MRLKKFSLQIEPSKTRLVEFDRYADKHAKEQNKKMETIYFLGFTHFCTRNRSGNYMVGRKTEKTRLRRSMDKLHNEIRWNRHKSIKEQQEKINQILRGHYNYYGLAGNIKALFQVYDKTKTYWRKIPSSRSTKNYVNWGEFREILSRFPLMRPKLSIPYGRLKMYAVLRSNF
jgi:RNA-directed DNA polymerase